VPQAQGDQAMRTVAVLMAGAISLGVGAEAQAGTFGSKKLDNCPVIKYVLKNCKLARKSGVKQALDALKKANKSKTTGKAKASKKAGK